MKRFRTTELSDPRFEADGLRFITVKTRHLRGRGDICVFVPSGYGRTDLPVVTLLHGVYGSCWCWALKGGAHRTAARMIAAGEIPPFVLAMPSDGLWGDGSGYLPHHGRDFGRWICEDVIDAVRLLVPEAKNSRENYLGGLSMGGYGTLRLAGEYPAVYQAASAHSSITRLEEMARFVEEPVSDYRETDTIEDVIDLFRNEQNLPRLRFDCGIEDELVSGNRLLHQQLTEARIDHVYEEFSGGHEWSYWEEHLVDSLRFFFVDEELDSD
ncbi:alpha/beta hydrolase [Neolewinella agarilytica]|uniref:alpha/beta hydrolase n=1 Tax=Neolewinella agarilytica TaxID=478744 RepID=UPI0023523064|nr:alpha/beta hydrolase-fold protein [Neolewinella agarilytica]